MKNAAWNGSRCGGDVLTTRPGKRLQKAMEAMAIDL